MKTKSVILFIFYLVFIIVHTPYAVQADETDFKFERQIEFNEGKIEEIEFSPDGDLLAIATHNMIKILETTGFSEMYTLTGFDEKVIAIAWNHNGSKIAGISEKNLLIKIWDIPSLINSLNLTTHDGEWQDPFGMYSKDPWKLADLCWSPDGAYFISSYSDAGGSTRIYDADTFENLITLTELANSGLDWVSDRIALGKGGSIDLKNPSNGVSDLIIPVPQEKYANYKDVNPSCFVGNNDNIATGVFGEIEIYSVEEGGSRIGKLGQHDGRITAISWSPAGDLIASAGQDLDILIWDYADVKSLQLLSEHSDRIYSLSWHPNSTYLASSSRDGVLIIWKKIESDNKKPTVEISNPTQDEPILDSVKVSGIASDDNAVSYVEIMIDDGLWLKVRGTNDWKYLLDSSIYLDGTHTISARAFDGELYSDVDSISVFFSNNMTDDSYEGWLVYIDIVGTYPDKIFSGQFDNLIEWKIIRGDFPNDSKMIIGFRVDGDPWTPLKCQGSSCMYPVDTERYPNGPRDLCAIAWYDGYVVGYTSVTVRFRNEHDPLNTPPDIEITYPNNNQMINNTISLKGNAHDDNEVLEIQIRVGHWDWTSVTPSLTNGNWSYDLDTSKYPNGSHFIFARSFDGEYFSEIDAVNVNINNSVEPGNGNNGNHNNDGPVDTSVLNCLEQVGYLLIILFILLLIMYFVYRKK
jgi:WD40 repeat protein